MTPQDVGVLSDSDEFASRDFLRAIQSCDFPELQLDESCFAPKIIPADLIFESSPYCMKTTLWFHPDFISGQCIDGIGDPTERIVPLRTHERRYGERHPSYGKENNNNYPEAIQKSGRYPLFTGPDFRTVHGHRGFLYRRKDSTLDKAFQESVSSPAYHLHNWFPNNKVLRHKYRTYGHAAENEGKTLSLIHRDVDIAVHCAKGLNKDANPYNWFGHYYPNGRDMKGTRPIYFLNVTCSEERHRLLQSMVLEDEAKYGSSYGSAMGRGSKGSLLEESEREKSLRKELTPSGRMWLRKGHRRPDSQKDLAKHHRK